MTNKDIWDFVMVCYQTENYSFSGLGIKSLLKIYQTTNDNYFYCGFHHSDKLIQFKIKIEYNLVGSWLGDGEKHQTFDIESWCGNSTVTETLLKELLKPVIRECKLNSIGI